ncbi:MAG: transketolase C-terminal domain-containing protein, partial [Acidimicrobiia bacterium]
LRLPVLYVVADNGWAISVPVAQQQSAPISQLVSGFPGLTVRTVDGCDYVAVRTAAAELTALLRKGEGPALLHASVTRPYSHSAQDTQSKYRTAADLAAEAARDPLLAMARLLTEFGLDVSAMPEDARQLVSLAAKRALAAPRPDPASVTAQLVDASMMVDAPAGDGPVGPADAPAVTMADTINKVLHERMAIDARIRVFGEDVADAPEHVMGEVPGKGGVFGITFGLQRTFGPDRCYNTPLAEANIVGRALGQAVRGLHPVAEVQFFDYIWPAMQQLRSAVGTLRWRTNGRFHAPMVVRVPIGGYLRGGAIWHSQSGESIFAHCPGLLIAFPSRARDAAGLLRTALDSDDPVLFLEHKHLYRQPYASDPYPEASFTVPFGRGRIARRGDDATVVTWGATVQRSLEAAEQLAADGVELEVIDLRTIVPWDTDIVAASVQRTNRLLVVHEDTLSGGFGGEIAAWAAQELFCDLDAPVMRVGALDVPVPYEPTLEDAVLPQVEGITQAMWKLVEF